MERASARQYGVANVWSYEGWTGFYCLHFSSSCLPAIIQ